MRATAVLLALALLLASSAAPAQLPDRERRRIADLAQRYFQHRADKVTNNAQTSGFGVPTTDALAAELRTHEVKLEARRARLSTLPFGGYSHAEVRTSLRRLDADQDGTVVAQVHELTALYFEESNSVTHTSYSMPHVLIFNRTATGWSLATATRPPGTKCGLPPETQFCGHLSER
jgi:hypothetical protein